MRIQALTSKALTTNRIFSQAGVTLIELVIVIAILAIVVSKGGATFSNWSRDSSFQTQISVVKSALIQARSLARSRQECVSVTLAPSTKTISVDSHTPGASLSCAAPLGVTTVPTQTFTLQNTTTFTTFSNGTNQLVFNVYGGLRDAPVATLQVTGVAGTQQVITVFPGIGQIRVN